MSAWCTRQCSHVKKETDLDPVLPSRLRKGNAKKSRERSMLLVLGYWWPLGMSAQLGVMAHISNPSTLGG